MANLIIQENGVARTRPAVNGEEITIKTPCSCSDVTGVQINGVAFPFYDALGNSLAGVTGLFAKNSLIRVMIDTDNTRAYILNRGVTAADVGAVKKSGDTMTGALKTPSLQCTALTAPTKIGKFLDFHVADVNTRTCRIYPTDDGRFVFNVPYVGEYFFLHTGNKPSGYYTGNGDATERKIDTKGIGNVCIIYGGAGIAIVTANGAICGGGDGPATPRSLPTSAIRFNSGVLTIKTADSVVNGNGGWYDYYVL